MDNYVSFYGWLSVSPSWKARIRLNPWHFSPFKEDFNEIVLPAGLTVRKPLSGWCSWYAFCSNINEKVILDQAEFIYKNKIPLEYIIVDDGWTKYGDWTEADPKRFPHGLAWLAEKLKELNLKLGLWFAPFLVDPNSMLAKKHTDWLVRDKKGKFFNGSGITKFKILDKKYVLDSQNPQVFEYLHQIVDKMIKECEVKLLKIDFLYAPYFDPKLASSETPNDIIKEFLGYIKSNYPKVATIASGPVSQMVGLVDATYFAENIITPQLDNLWPINSIMNGYRLHNLIKAYSLRKGIEKVFNLDPDVFVCRSSTGFSEKQIDRLFNFVKKTRGDIFLGDDLTKLPRQKIEKYILPLLARVDGKFLSED